MLTRVITFTNSQWDTLVLAFFKIVLSTLLAPKSGTTGHIPRPKSPSWFLIFKAQWEIVRSFFYLIGFARGLPVHTPITDCPTVQPVCFVIRLHVNTWCLMRMMKNKNLLYSRLDPTWFQPRKPDDTDVRSQHSFMRPTLNTSIPSMDIMRPAVPDQLIPFSVRTGCSKILHQLRGCN